jgi:hypothetical protein
MSLKADRLTEDLRKPEGDPKNSTPVPAFNAVNRVCGERGNDLGERDAHDMQRATEKSKRRLNTLRGECSSHG